MTSLIPHRCTDLLQEHLLEWVALSTTRQFSFRGQQVGNCLSIWLCIPHQTILFSLKAIIVQDTAGQNCVQICIKFPNGCIVLNRNMPLICFLVYTKITLMLLFSLLFTQHFFCSLTHCNVLIDMHLSMHCAFCLMFYIQVFMRNYY